MLLKFKMKELNMKTTNVFNCFSSLKLNFKVVLLGIIVLSDLIFAQNLEGKSCNLRNNDGVGTCQLRSKCPYFRDWVPGNPRPKVCGFKEANLPYICCPEEYQEAVSRTKYHSDSNERISITKCKEYLPEQQTVTVNFGGIFETDIVTKCRDRTVPLIVGGQNAEEGEFPFMVAIGWESFNGDHDYDYNCGGSLISENFVLTAAHCSYLIGYPKPAPVIVRLGDLNLKSSTDDANVRSIKIKSIINHERYNYTSHNHDIALIEMEDRIPVGSFNKFIAPACLWTKTDSDFTVNNSIAIGWGEQQSEKREEQLQKVSLNLYKNDECQKIYAKHSTRLPNGIVDSMLCSGYLEGGRDSCQGDSGGPLLIKNNVNNCNWFHVIGVTSFGNGCAQRKVAGVYTRVASYVDWIERHVWPK